MSDKDKNIKSYIPGVMQQSQMYAVIATDMQGCFIYVNDCFKQRFRHINEHFEGQPFSNSIHPEDNPKAMQAAEQCIRNPGSPVIVMLRKPGLEPGSYIMTRWEFSLLTDHEQNPLGILAVGHDATEEEVNRQQLQESKLRLRAILDSTTDSNLLISSDYKILSFNKAAWQASKLVFGKPVYEGADIFEFVLPADKEDFLRDSALVLKGISSAHDRQINGYWFQFRYYPVYDKAGSITGFTLNTTFIDERKKAEEYRRALLRSLPDDLYVIRTDGVITDARVNQQSGNFREAGITGKQLDTLFESNTSENLMLQVRAAVAENRPGELAFSVFKNGENHHYEARISPFETDKAMVLLRDVSQRVRAAEEREKVARYMAQVSRNAPGVIYQYRLMPDGSSYFPFASEGIFKLFDVSPEQLETDAMHVLQHIHPDDQQAYHESVRASAQSLENWEHTFRIIHKSGREIWLEGKSTPQREADGSVVWNGYIHNVTERTLAAARLNESKEALRKSEAKYRKMVELLSEGIIVHEVAEQNPISECNASAARILGLTREELLYLTSFDSRWDALNDDGTPARPEDHPSVITMRTGEPVCNAIMGVRKPDGDRVWILINSEPITDPKTQKPRQVLVSFTDITEFRYAEDEIKKSEQRMRNLLELQTCYVIRTDIKGRYTYVNPKYLDSFGHLYPESGSEKPAYLGADSLDSIIPEDWPKVYQVIQNLIAEPSKVIQVDIRKPLENGEIAYTLWDFSTISGRDGQIHEIQCVGIDYTDRKEQERIIEESEHKLQQTIESIPDPMLIFDEDFRIQFVNEKFEELYGYTEQEVLGKTMDFLIDEKYSEGHRLKQERYLNEGGKNVRMDFFLPTSGKGDKEIVVNASLNTFLAGGKKSIIVILQDVTELKMRQDIILRQNETLRKIAWKQSHELRRPVANILGLCNIFDEFQDKSPAEQQNVITWLQQSVQELDTIIRETVKQANESEFSLRPPEGYRG
ncbi:MAG: PAS domain S-box protein [Balneolales bacterium]|nr:PAS domain S-box protein [Balneolales bacterium]